MSLFYESSFNEIEELISCIQIKPWVVIHSNGNVVNLTNSSSLAALFSAANNENFVKMMTLPFQFYNAHAIVIKIKALIHNYTQQNIITT